MSVFLPPATRCHCIIVILMILLCSLRTADFYCFPAFNICRCLPFHFYCHFASVSYTKQEKNTVKYSISAKSCELLAKTRFDHDLYKAREKEDKQ